MPLAGFLFDSRGGRRNIISTGVYFPRCIVTAFLFSVIGAPDKKRWIELC